MTSHSNKKKKSVGDCESVRSNVHGNRRICETPSVNIERNKDLDRLIDFSGYELLLTSTYNQ